jgi:hypothetical protein
MAITRTTDGALIVGDLSMGGRAISISDDADAPNIAVIGWLEEGVGMDLTFDEAVAIRDELDRFIRKSTL